jgi:uncharacterized phage protein (TIGR01671 family)
MKRPIKFRFWCNAGKSFIQQYRYRGYVDELFDEKEWDILTPSQYTGIKDCEGKEIWEGDIVEFERPVTETERKKFKAVVEFVEGAFLAKTINPERTLSFFWLHNLFDSHEFNLKVIGNKWENPEIC